MTDDDMRVSLKEYFEALRKEDQKALELLGREIALRLDRLDGNIGQLKSSFDVFYAASSAQHSAGQRLGVTITAIISAVIGAIAAMAATLFTRH